MILIENKMPKHGSDAGCWFRCCNFVSFIFILSPNSSLSIFSGCKWPADTSSTVSIASSIETVVTSKDFNWLNRKEKERKDNLFVLCCKCFFYIFSTLSLFPVPMSLPLSLHSVLPKLLCGHVGVMLGLCCRLPRIDKVSLQPVLMKAVQERFEISGSESSGQGTIQRHGQKYGCIPRGHWVIADQSRAELPPHLQRNGDFKKKKEKERIYYFLKKNVEIGSKTLFYCRLQPSHLNRKSSSITRGHLKLWPMQQRDPPKTPQHGSGNNGLKLHAESPSAAGTNARQRKSDLAQTGESHLNFGTARSETTAMGLQKESSGGRRWFLAQHQPLLHPTPPCSPPRRRDTGRRWNSSWLPHGSCTAQMGFAKPLPGLSRFYKGKKVFSWQRNYQE